MTNRTGIALFMLFAVSAADAQVSRGRYGPAKTPTTAQRGVQQEPKPDPVPVTVVRRHPSSPSVLTPVPTPVKVVLIPAVLMSDGSIFADFGFGMEPVRHACAGVSASSGGRVIAGNGQVLSQPAPHLQPVPQMQPVPRMQPAPGMQPFPGQTSYQRQLSSAAQKSCFTRDASGRVFATR